jgi:hypothetical protein
MAKTPKPKTRGWRGKIPWSKDKPSYWPVGHEYYRGPIEKGGQLGYEDYGCLMVDNFVFEDTLTFETCSRGRSSATFVFNRSDGSSVEFFMNETARLFPHFVDGKVPGRFTFVKRGANYSCSILEPSELA